MDDLVQIIIIVCLLIVIFLLAVDKVKMVKNNKRQTDNNETSEIIDIMGKPNLIRERVYNKPIDIHKKMLKSTHFFAEPKSVPTVVSTDESSIGSPIYDEWDDEPLPYDDRFSKAVSMEEMMNVGKLLQQSDLGSEQENVVVDVMQKVQGTELYGLLESSIGDASQRIARLLDRNIKINEAADYNPRDGYEKFDIDDFI